MHDHSPKQPPPWLGIVGWLPIVAYFVVKYLIVGSEAMTGRQNLMLLGAVILAEIALWQYRRQFRPRKNEENNGTHPEG
jgi:hypothetical protein